jgi:serine protease Do
MPVATLLQDNVSTELAELVAQVRPGVVQVHSSGRGGGAGIIWRADGLILTNAHVVGRSGRAVEVHLADGRRLEATVTDQNPALDLAALKVDAADLPAATIGDSQQLRVGELVFAIGHPWGQRDVVTAGIVSCLGCVKVRGTDEEAPFIRSDVALAPGNSGGPLLNAAGAVVGINAMIMGGDLSVAIPSHTARTWLDGLGRRVHLGIGLRPARLTPSRGGAWAGQAAGLLVVTVTPDGPAARAGVQVGDVLLGIDGQPLDNPHRLLDILAQSAAKATVQLHLLRGGAVLALTVPGEVAPLG